MSNTDSSCREVLNHTKWISIVTNGAEGAHAVATWGDYTRALGITDDTIIIPAGGCNKTKENLKRDNRVELLIASTKVLGERSIGR